jgi:pullulanase/glycogen debranching enzyme
MIRAGDEMARSQRGNNNGYCQDNELSWLAWPGAGDDEAKGLAAFVASLLALRRRRPELRRDTFFKGSPREGRQPDVRWLHPVGRDMQAADWSSPGLKSLGMLLGADSPEKGDLLVLLSAEDRDVGFTLPDDVAGGWRVCLDSGDIREPAEVGDVESPVRVQSRCVIVLERR